MSPSESDTRDRLIALEVEVRHLAETLSEYGEKVKVMHDILVAAKGMRWLIVAMAATSGFMASFATKFIPFWR
jgi:predicted exporter